MEETTQNPEKTKEIKNLFITEGELNAFKSYNVIQEFLNDLLGDHTQFSPGKHFYQKVGITAHKWYAIYRGQKSPTLKELQDIAAYFGKNISVITDKRQLKLFDVRKDT